MGLGGKARALNQVLFSYRRMQEAVDQGRSQELLTLYEPCFQDLMVYCLGKCKNLEMAEDAASETLKAFLEHPNKKGIPNLKAWLLSVAHNITIKMLDKEIRRGKILDRIGETMSTLHEMDIDAQLDFDALDQVIESILNGNDYRIWKLEGQGFKDEEIAQKLEMNPKTVSNRKSLIKKALRKKLTGYKGKK